MAKRGPKPKREAQGPILTGRPKPPAFLDDEARKHWREVAALAEESGLLSLLDRDALTLYCSHWSTWRRAVEEMTRPRIKVGADGKVVEADPEGEVITARNGYRQPNPWYTIATQAMKDMKPFLDMFGLSPKARSKLQLPEPDDDPGAKWDGLA